MSYLSTLQGLGLATYQQPLAGKERRGIWSIADPYLRFWFHFVLPHKAQIDHGANPERLYREAVAPALDHFVSKPAFEEICRAWVLDQSDRGEIPQVASIGAWWGPIPQPTPDNPRNQAEGELEIVGVTQTRISLFGEAKWTKEPLGFSVANHLRMVARYVPGADESAQFYLFGRAFDGRLRANAAREQLRLVDTETLYSVPENSI